MIGGMPGIEHIELRTHAVFANLTGPDSQGGDGPYDGGPFAPNVKSIRVHLSLSLSLFMFLVCMHMHAPSSSSLIHKMPERWRGAQLVTVLRAVPLLPVVRAPLPR